MRAGLRLPRRGYQRKPAASIRSGSISVKNARSSRLPALPLAPMASIVVRGWSAVGEIAWQTVVIRSTHVIDSWALTITAVHCLALRSDDYGDAQWNH